MEIAFVYVTDERGFDLAIHSAASVALAQEQRCDVHIFCYRFAPAQVEGLQSALDRIGGRLTFHAIEDRTVEHFETHGHVTTPTLLKLAAVERIAADYDRVVYLDNDVLIFDNLPVADLDLGAAPLGAVVDMDVSHSGAHRHAGLNAGGEPSPVLQRYFNAGVLVFACEAMQDDGYARRYRDALEAHRTGCDFKRACTSGDQCALNTAFEGGWQALPLSFNLQAGAKFTEAWQTARVRHYCGSRKFLPLSWFRNDGRDVALLNRIRTALGRPALGRPGWHGLLFWLNAVRKYRANRPMRRLLRAAAGQPRPAPQP